MSITKDNAITIIKKNVKEHYEDIVFFKETKEMFIFNLTRSTTGLLKDATDNEFRVGVYKSNGSIERDPQKIMLNFFGMTEEEYDKKIMDTFGW